MVNKQRMGSYCAFILRKKRSGVSSMLKLETYGRTQLPGDHHGVDPILQTSERTGCKDAQDGDLRSCQDQAISIMTERVSRLFAHGSVVGTQHFH